jgi:4'-phosphopantetheinyl transferase EntD
VEFYIVDEYIEQLLIKANQWLLPDGVAVASLNKEITTLFSGEIESVRRAVAKRQREFAAGRWCARVALEKLGSQPVEIPVGKLQQPIWPSGFIGSITHDNGIAMAAVRPNRGTYSAIGIDLHFLRNKEHYQNLTHLVCNTREYTNASHHLSENIVIPMVFSAKEAAIKALSPVIGQFIDFTEVEIKIDEHTFFVYHSQTGTHVAGQWAKAGHWLFTLALESVK